MYVRVSSIMYAELLEFLAQFGFHTLGPDDCNQYQEGLVFTVLTILAISLILCIFHIDSPSTSINCLTG